MAVIGGGWAGLAAAIELSAAGRAVQVFEMAGTLGGRARRAGVLESGLAFDNGQHILIGAYVQTLRLMQLVGADPELLLLRTPLNLRDPQGLGLALPPGPPLLAFLRGLLGARHWTWAERASLLRSALIWSARGFRCPADQTVAELSRGIAPRVVQQLIEPLCVAALNTDPRRASAAVFLRVLRDALFSVPGASDLLLPRADLGLLLPDAASRHLAGRGVKLQLRCRVLGLEPGVRGWRLETEQGTYAADAVVLAATAIEAARLVRPHAPAWSDAADAVLYEPIITVWLRCTSTELPSAMLRLSHGPADPAQFVFDLGRLQGAPGSEGLLAFVISGAAAWVEAGAVATAEAVTRQARAQLGPWLPSEIMVVKTIIERRATFSCIAGLDRPGPDPAPALFAAGDYLQGPYPSTLEGAVLSGIQAARRVQDHLAPLSAPS